MSQHVQIVFRVLFEELASMKEQQWKITYYAVLLLAAAFALKSHSQIHADPRALSAMAWATAIGGSLLLLRIQWYMGKYRMRIDGLHGAYFTERERIDIGLTDRERRGLGKMKRHTQALRGSIFVSVLIIVLIAGALLVSCAS
jgi:hypothetical protein